MTETEKKMANFSRQEQAASDKETKPMYCMIAPTADDVLDNADDGTVCSNRS